MTADWLPDGDSPIPFDLTGPPEFPPLCPDLETWVETVYAPTFIRKITQMQRWCPSWWAHAEAIVRLRCLWQTWEAARVAEQPDAMADWLRSFFDLINPVLLSPDGPFAACTPDRHSDPTPMPTTPAPPDWWSENGDGDG